MTASASLGKDLDDTEFVNIEQLEGDDDAGARRICPASCSNDWTWDAYYQYGINEREQVSTRVRVNHFFQYALDAVDEGRFRTGVPNGNIVCRATLLAVVPAAAAGLRADEPVRHQRPDSGGRGLRLSARAGGFRVHAARGRRHGER